MSFNPLDYKGNSIFRGQPNHTYFDKPYEDGRDPLFMLLNDIDPYFWKPEQKAEKLNIFDVSLKDPRTQKPLNQLEYDHTKEKKLELFNSPKRSLLNEKQHEMCVQALNAMQYGLEAGEVQMFNWCTTHNTRQKEKQSFQKYMSEFCQTNKDFIYASCRKLLELYQKWYKNKSENLMLKYPQESYNTHLGLPHLRLCKNALIDIQVEISNQEIITKVGDDCGLVVSNTTKEFEKLKHRIESYLEVYLNSEDMEEETENALLNFFIKQIQRIQSDIPVLYIPLESLLFLLTAGDYIDISTEMLINIKETECGNKKIIIMEPPLPSRNAGWHTYQQIVEQGVIAILSINQIKQEIKDCGKDLEQPISMEKNYKVTTLKEFMRNCRSTPDKLCKFSKTLVKWLLNPSDGTSPLQIYTSISSSPSKEDDPTNSVSFKLEYKPQFGCEIMTKYELLREWLKLKLLQRRKSTCFRLDTTTYQTLLQEPLNIDKLEDYLSTTYHTNCKQLLSNLFEFLKMLLNMCCGHYMLRFNPKFKDKLMLCKPSTEITQNTIHLHKLLEADVNNIIFMSQQSFLPIDVNLCSLMHLQHNILPCAFSPQTKGSIATFQKKLNKSDKKRKKETPKTKTKQQLKKQTNRSKLKRRARRMHLFEDKEAKTET